MFFFVVITTWTIGHAYLAHRLVLPLRKDSTARRSAWLLLLLSFLLVPVSLSLRRTGVNPALNDALALVAYLDMGIFMVLVPLLAALDSGRVIARLIRMGWSAHTGNSLPPEDPQRRRFLANTLNAAILGLTGGMTVAGYREARRYAQVKHVTVPVADLPPALDGFHIVQLSDIHLGPTIKGDYLRGIVERCNALQPDLVAITGDLVDGLTWQLQDDVAPLAELVAPHGRWFVTGNHEYYWGAQDWMAYLDTLGVNVLDNAHTVIEQADARLLLAGVPDYRESRRIGGTESNPFAAREGAAKTDVSILLAHQPRSAFAGVTAGYDLQLSGHVHGGQFFPWNLFIGLVQPYSVGLHRVRDRMWLYVSAGTGYWGPPTRLGVPAEISSIRLVPA